MKQIVVFVVGTATLISNAAAFQGVDVGRWKSYTDLRAVRAIATSSDSVWVATSGGVFFFHAGTQQITKFTNSEGLSSNDITAATFDRYGRLWIGSAEGFVNMYDPVSREWIEIRSIAESNRVQKAIRTLLAQNDSLLLGTDFGVVVYLMRRGEFGDTYANFGFSQQPRVNDILVHNNVLWVATESGVAAASLSSSNLSSPTAWSRYAAGTDLASANVRSLAVFRDTLYAGTGGGVSYFVNSSFIVIQDLRNKAIVSMRPSGQTTSDRLFIVWNESNSYNVATIASANAQAQVIATNSSHQSTALASRPSSTNLWIGTTSQGLAQWNGSQWRYQVPNGPSSNLFISLAVDRRGVLWAGSGISDRGAGFYRFEPSQPEDRQWKNYTVQEYPMMAFNDYYKVSVGKEGSLWASSWGRGVVEVVNDSIRRRISVPALAGAVPQDPNYVVVGSVVADASDKTWFVNRSAINGSYLARLTGDSTFDYFSKAIVPSEGRLTSMVIDRFGTKWIANSEPQDKPATGLTFFNEGQVVIAGIPSINGWGLITTPQLPDNNVLSLALDLDGDVCVGTDAGLLIISLNVVDSRNQTLAATYTKPLAVAGQIVQAIAVDALNNKWVGTKDGIVVLSPDGIQVLQFHSTATTNGKLISNDIRALAIDQKRGVIYIGTERGLSTLEIAPVQAARSYTALEFGPNPYLIPSAGRLVIRNLVSNSSIRILSVNGSLVSEFPAQGGGRAFWDGRDSNGDFVPSGIYFVIAYAENGNQLTTGKIAVVRR